jgi:hypothetical protein
MRTRKGDTIVRLLKKQRTENPSIQGVWNPFTNKDPSIAAHKYPSEPLSSSRVEKTATEKILELYKSQAVHTAKY